MQLLRQTSALLAIALATSAPAGAQSPAQLSPCEEDRFGPRAECGRLAVPENPDTEGGRSIELNVVVQRAAEPSGKEPVFMLAGGPGQAAQQLAGLALRPFRTVNEVRDFVLVDHRGTGDSNPIHCASDAASDPAAAFGALFRPAQIAKCLEQAGEHADVTLYTSRQAVRDLEAVREWLGYDRVLLWGGSGGTRTGLVYLRDYPDSIAAALFDGIVPTNFAAPSGFAPAAQRALDRVFEDCAAQPSCAAAYPRLEQDFEKLLGRFAGGPLAARVETDQGEVEVEVHRDDVAYTVRGLLYNRRRIARIPAMIHEAATTGDVGEFAQAHWQRTAAVLPSIAIGVHLAVYCAEDLPFIDHEVIAAATRDSFLGDYLLEQYGNACKAWHSVPEPAGFTAPVTANVPVLMFSGHYDPSTPDGLAEETARALPRARHVVARNEGHGAQFGCARPLAIDFLMRATLEGLEPACEKTGPIEFEVPASSDAAAG